jgi:hypothetical protein
MSRAVFHQVAAGAFDLAEYRGQGAGAAVLDPGALDPVGVHDIGHAGLGERPQGQVVLEQSPGHLAHRRAQHVLQLRMRHRRGLRPGKIGRHLLEQAARDGERVLGRGQRTVGRPGPTGHLRPASVNRPGSVSSRTPRSSQALEFRTHRLHPRGRRLFPQRGAHLLAPQRAGRLGEHRGDRR